MIRVSKKIAAVIVISFLVIAGSLGMAAGGIEPVDAITCVTGVINEK